MMDFLRGLAPRRDGDISWAAPVVRSRFGGQQPIGVEPVADVPSAPTGDVGRESHRSEIQSTPRPAVGDRADANVALPVARPVASTEAPLAPPREIHHHHHEPRVVERVITPVVTPPDAPRLVTRVATQLPAEPASALRSEQPAAEAGAPLAVPKRPLLQIEPVHAPLSPAAVAGRRAAPATDRAVVHVTIDRIEVRAPGTTRPAARSSRGRATSPSVSLADYLRGPRKGGGAR